MNQFVDPTSIPSVRERLLRTQVLTPKSQPCQIRHNGENDPTPALNYFLQHLAWPLCADVFNVDGSLQEPTKTEVNPYTLSIPDLETFLLSRLEPYYELIDHSLENVTKFGFNRHGSEHTLKTTKDAMQILEIASASEDQIKRVMIAGYLHDVGNIFGRQEHEAISVNMAEQIIPELTTDKEQWQIVKNVILFHNEPSLTLYFDAVKAQSPSEKVKALAKLPQETLALILADKTQLGHDRVTRKKLGLSALGKNDQNEVDWHLFINLMAESRPLLVDFSDETITWLLSFTPGITMEEQKRLKQFEQPGKPRHSHVPEALHRLHREFGIPHVDSWQSMFYQKYLDRIILDVEVAFALFPDIQNFTIAIEDRDILLPNSKGGLISESFNRQDINNIKYYLLKKYCPKTDR